MKFGGDLFVGLNRQQKFSINNPHVINCIVFSAKLVLHAHLFVLFTWLAYKCSASCHRSRQLLDHRCKQLDKLDEQIVLAQDTDLDPRN